MNAQLVYTTAGMVPISDLEIVDVIEVGENYRKIVTIFRLNGEVVRQSAAIEMLRPVSTASTPGAM